MEVNNLKIIKTETEVNSLKAHPSNWAKSISNRAKMEKYICKKELPHHHEEGNETSHI